MAHGEYLRDRVERERRGMPDGAPDGNRRCWGNIAWRLNDSWPMIYSSVIDYYLEPKIAYYFLRRAYKPMLVSFEKTQDQICGPSASMPPVAMVRLRATVGTETEPAQVQVRVSSATKPLWRRRVLPGRTMAFC
jgi:beta-galactosidase/beta-glucuronidase